MNNFIFQTLFHLVASIKKFTSLFHTVAAKRKSKRTMEKKVWYIESDLYQFDIVTRKGKNLIHTEIDRKSANKRHDIDVGDIIVYKHGLAPRLYVGRVYEVTVKATRVVVLGVGDDLYTPWNKRGDFTEVDRAYIAKATSLQQRYPPHYVQKYDVDPSTENFEDMSVDELCAYVAQKVKEADDRLAADIATRACSACLALASMYDKKQYAIRRVVKKNEADSIYVVARAIQNRHLMDADTQYHFHMDYVKIGVVNAAKQASDPMRFEFFEGCVDFEKGTMRDLLPSPELHVSSTFIKRLCECTLEIIDLQPRMDQFVQNKMAAFNDSLKEVLSQFPHGITTFALFRAEYNRLFDKDRAQFFLHENNRTQDASFLWHRYLGNVKTISKKIKK